MVLVLTDDWTDLGTPVEWGIEPVLNRIKAMDLWRDDQKINRLQAEQERKEQDRKRMQRNEMMAVASELRKDFARATDDVVVRADSKEKLKWQ